MCFVPRRDPQAFLHSKAYLFLQVTPTVFLMAPPLSGLLVSSQEGSSTSRVGKLSVKGQRVSMSSFVGPTTSVVAVQLWHRQYVIGNAAVFQSDFIKTDGELDLARGPYFAN